MRKGERVKLYKFLKENGHTTFDRKGWHLPKGKRPGKWMSPIKGKLIAATEAAVARGVFGVPTFFIGTEMYFGQDHLDFIETALSAAAP